MTAVDEKKESDFTPSVQEKENNPRKFFFIFRAILICCCRHCSRGEHNKEIHEFAFLFF